MTVVTAEALVVDHRSLRFRGGRGFGEAALSAAVPLVGGVARDQAVDEGEGEVFAIFAQPSHPSPLFASVLTFRERALPVGVDTIRSPGGIVCSVVRLRGRGLRVRMPR